ncbi:AsnC family transcriptional regulator [Haloarchaeobius amylolyticus]|uniref:AsnC family transcriptional regulator n=1 Tax=Haloarchaeobius amylolyticus TaxID=1198296 RepID=UPI00226D64AF|nr:AsnC family transcriptional regulator [Haloarchaeobius amylolyticus]
MRDLDDTDMEILRALADDARRSFADIGEQVGLSGPAVSDRVKRLQEVGVVRGFTVDVDRSQLREGTPVLVRLELDAGMADAVKADLREAEAVEHLFTAADGDLTFHARVPDTAVHRWLASVTDTALVRDVSVELLSNVDWSPSVGGTEFALECAECGNTVTSEGVSARVGDSVYNFCCTSCEGRFRNRYERLEEGA